MEETKELQTVYKIFRTLIYVSLVVEFFEYAIEPLSSASLSPVLVLATRNTLSLMPVVRFSIPWSVAFS